MIPQVDNIGSCCDSTYIHVYPTFGRAHITVGDECWCHPEQDPDNPLILLHNVEH